MDKLRIALRILLPLVVIGLGIGVARKLVKARPTAGKTAVAHPGALVEVQPVGTVDRRLTLRAQGTVIAAREVVLQPQISGKVLSVHSELVPGGRLPADTTLVRIEDADYRLGVAQARTQVEQARQTLELERGRQAIAKREWSMLPAGRREKADASAKARALREPQLAQAQAQIDAANAALRQARLNVARAELKAPFNALVLQENVDIGQVVSPGAQVARLVGTDAFWVQVSVPLADLKWLTIPKTPEAQGSAVTVRLDTGDGVVEREGKVIRLLGDLDPVGRLARVMVQIDDPLGLTSGAPPLLLGAFVEVAFTGKHLRDVVEVPRQALQEGDVVWIYADGKLEVRPVEIGRRLRESVLVTKGLTPGEQLITSRLATPVPGMPLRRVGDAPAEASPAKPRPIKAGAATPASAARPASRAEVIR